jgi:hypothetical protein
MLAVIFMVIITAEVHIGYRRNHTVAAAVGGRETTSVCSTQVDRTLPAGQRRPSGAANTYLALHNYSLCKDGCCALVVSITVIDTAGTRTCGRRSNYCCASVHQRCVHVREEHRHQAGRARTHVGRIGLKQQLATVFRNIRCRGSHRATVGSTATRLIFTAQPGHRAAGHCHVAQHCLAPTSVVQQSNIVNHVAAVPRAHAVVLLLRAHGYERNRRTQHKCSLRSSHCRAAGRQ